MRKISTLLSFLLVTIAYSQTIDWAYSLGSASGGEYGKVIEQDDLGNTYIAGRIFFVTDFDLGPATFNLSPQNYHSGYLAKYDPNMQLIWAIDIGGPEYQHMNSIAIDDNYNVYVTGSFKNSISFDASTTYMSNGNYDMFLAKYNSNGQLLWSHACGSPGIDWGTKVDIDPAGNVYWVGYFSGTFDIDPGPNVTYLFNSGSFDGFLAKFTPQGDLNWRVYIGGQSADQVNAIGFDDLANVYLTGTFSSTCDFIVGSNNHLISASNIDIFIAKYDSSSQFQWAYDIGGGTQFGSNCQANDIVVEPSGAFAITGLFWGPAQFDPIGNTAQFIPLGGDCFVAKYDEDANYQWMQYVGLAQDVPGHAMAMDDQGNMYVTGHFADSIDFDPGASVDMRYSLGNYDPFVWSLDANGGYRWTMSLGSTGQESGHGISIANDSTLLITGSINGTVDFNPNGMPYQLNTTGTQDIYIAKYSMETAGPNGLTETELDQILVYPNPTNGALNFELPENGRFELSIFDIAGALLGSWKSDSRGSLTVNTQQWAAGSYLYRARGATQHYVGRVIVE